MHETCYMLETRNVALLFHVSIHFLKFLLLYQNLKIYLKSYIPNCANINPSNQSQKRKISHTDFNSKMLLKKRLFKLIFMYYLLFLFSSVFKSFIYLHYILFYMYKIYRRYNISILFYYNDHN